MENELKHTAMDFIERGKQLGSLKEACEEFMVHADDYGITNIEELFPDAKDVNNEPQQLLNNNMAWVSEIIGGAFKLPFARIKSSYADLTGEELRAKGYVKGKKKTEDVVTVFKRSTTPTTIYKKQKLDRDDIIDITDFKVVGWIKRNMRIKLDEEIARCILIGDGRLTSSDDYVDRECIRPIHTDDDVYSIKVSVANDADICKNFIKGVIKSRKEYRGSGEPSLYMGEDFLADLLLLEDKNGRTIYNSEQELAKKLRVKNIVTAPILENVERTDKVDAKHKLLGIVVNIRDYSIGTNAGGQVALFEDFDIDYNQEKYLIETRLSGALTTPYSAMVIETPVVPVNPVAQEVQEEPQTTPRVMGGRQNG